jgi:hypothetical protein
MLERVRAQKVGFIYINLTSKSSLRALWKRFIQIEFPLAMRAAIFRLMVPNEQINNQANTKGEKDKKGPKFMISMGHRFMFKLHIALTRRAPHLFSSQIDLNP